MRMPIQDLLDCSRCQEELNKPFLDAACASVGIEHGMTTGHVLYAYLAKRHDVHKHLPESPAGRAP